MVSASEAAMDTTHVQYWSKTRSGWLNATVLARDTRSGAIQIDKKPGIWLAVDDPRVRKSVHPPARHALPSTRIVASSGNGGPQDLDCTRAVERVTTSAATTPFRGGGYVTVLPEPEEVKRHAAPPERPAVVVAAPRAAASGGPAPRAYAGAPASSASPSKPAEGRGVPSSPALPSRPVEGRSVAATTASVAAAAAVHEASLKRGVPPTPTVPSRPPERATGTTAAVASVAPPAQAGPPGNAPAPQGAPAEPGETPADAAQLRRIGIKYRCPVCNALVESMGEAVEHCAAAAAGGPAGEEGQPAEEEAEPLPPGECIAYDEQGRPMIVRQVDPESGVARTFVRNEDNSQSVFGDGTVASLAKASKAKALEWAAALTGNQLRGLTHEVGQRLLAQSRSYHAGLSELEKMSEVGNYIYFGLNLESSDKEVDNAYRRMAREMHPDKNGGTDEAKNRFQQMKDRYEAIKKKRKEPSPEGEVQQQQQQQQQQQHQQQSQQSQQQEQEQEQTEQRHSTEEQEDQQQLGSDERERRQQMSEESGSPRTGERKKPGRMEYDPKDKDSMADAVVKMAAQLKQLESQMEVLTKEIERVHSQIPPGMYD